MDNKYFDEQNNNTPVRRKKSKLLTGTIALAAALGVTVSAIGISSAAPATDEETGKEAIELTLSTAVEEETTEASDFILMDVSDVVKEALPSVVSITSRQIINYYGDNFFGGNGGLGDLGDIFGYFFGDSFGGRGGRNHEYYHYEEVPEESQEESGDTEETPNEVDSGMGSGTIIAMNDEELLILTSYHVVEGSSSLYVTFIDDSNVDGYIKSADEGKDIAIVAIPLADIPQETLDVIKVATIATEEPEVGDGVIVIGNALGYGISVTTGIISALDREVYVEGHTLQLLQTDAAINNGNSGGCMLNSKGEVIGINEAKVILTYVEGMCYAIPVVSNLDLIEQLINSEGTINSIEPAQGSGAYIGIRGRDVTIDVSNDFGMPMGVYISSTVKGSGAEDAGLQSGDIIVGIDGKDITTMEELQYELSFHSAGDVITLSIMRMTEGEYTGMDIDVTLTDIIS